MKSWIFTLAATTALAAGAIDGTTVWEDVSPTNKVKDVVERFAPAPDFSTNNTELVETIQATAPATNIPKTALAQDVQASLGLADSAVQPSSLSGYATTAQLAGKLDRSGGMMMGALAFYDSMPAGGNCSIYYNLDRWHFKDHMGSEIVTPLYGTGTLALAAPNPTYGNLAALDFYGNPTDSGIAKTAVAPLASPAFTGTPTAPTPTAGDNSTKVATTAYVQGALSAVAQSATNYTDSATNNLVSFVKDRNGNYTAVTIGTRGSGYGGVYSLANGTNVVATGHHSHAEGSGTTASGSYSHAEGRVTTAEGTGCHAEGVGTTAKGSYSHAEGNYTEAENYAHAEGRNTKAYYGSHAEGSHTEAYTFSHADGAKARTARGGTGHQFAYCWRGWDNYLSLPSDYYESHGPGTYNISPVGGTDGFWIGETNFSDHVRNIASTVVPSGGAVEKRVAMFILPLNITTNEHYMGVELKATTNNFSGASSGRTLYFTHTSTDDGSGVAGEFPDSSRVFVESHLTRTVDAGDQRSYVRVGYPLSQGDEDTLKASPALVVIVDASLLWHSRSDTSWLSDQNEELIWTYSKIGDTFRENDDNGRALWRPCSPVRWFRSVPKWAEQNTPSN